MCGCIITRCVGGGVWVHHHQVRVGWVGVCGCIITRCVCVWVGELWRVIMCVCVLQRLTSKDLNVHVVRVLLQSVLYVAGLKDGPKWRIPHHWQLHDQRYMCIVT